MRLRMIGAVVVLAGGLAGCDSSSTEGDGGCGAMCNGVCCAVGESCIQLACCPAAQSCGDTCCVTGAVCANDGDGGRSCATVCSTNAACPSATPCCGLTPSGMTACIAMTAGAQCRCTSAFDCSTTACCAPATDSSGDPVGPYVCKPNDGANYNCSTDAGACTGSGCRAVDPNGSYICIKPCTDGGTQCGASRCVSYTLPSDTTCYDGLGCGL